MGGWEALLFSFVAVGGAMGLAFLIAKGCSSHD